jgi:hypothetical protein
MKARLVLTLAALAAALALVASGCGGSGGSGSGGGDAATLAPIDSSVYIEGTVRPEGSLKADIESLAANVAGITDPGGLIIGQLESEASSEGEEFDYEKEIEPWLGERAGLFLREYDGEDFQGYGIAIETTDAAATQKFVDAHTKEDKSASYEGTDFMVSSSDGTAVGVVGDLLVIAEDKKAFESAVDASNGESLADDERYTAAVAGVPDDSLADVYVDIGGLIQESGGSVDPEARQLLETAGIEAKEATAVASLIPGSDQVEIDVSSDAAGSNAPTGDASALLESLPGGSFAALAAPGFGKSLGEAIDNLDKSGIPGQIPPNELKKTMSAAGIDLDKISASIGDVGAFAEGNSERNLTGAVVFETTGSEGANTVANIGTLLRASGTPGVTALSGKASGFSIRNAQLGSQPLVVAAEGDRVAISYGLAASAQALTAGGGSTLASNPEYKEAVAALGGTPISGFVNGPAALALAKGLIPAEAAFEFEAAEPFLEKVSYVAIGSGSSGDLATAKLIVGLAK